MVIIKRISFRMCAAAVAVVSAAVFGAVPSAPVLLLPAGGATAVDTPVTFRWNRSPANPDTADDYTLQIATDTNFTLNTQNFITITDTAYTVHSVTYNMKYFWHVQGRNVDGSGAWSATRSFTTRTYVPAAPVLLSPADGATGQAVNPTISWNAVTGAAQYGVQVSPDPSFATSLLVNDSTPSLSWSIAGGLLVNGRSYFWRVQARNIIGDNGPWTRWRFSTLQESYASWTYQKRLVLNTTSANGGAGIPAQTYNVPVLVRLNGSTFGWLNQCASGGADVRFARPNGTALPYEIERWKDNDSAEIWVLLDMVKSSGLDTIVMYWGNGGATTRSDPYRVFDAYTGFSHVWHMDTVAVRDRTQNGCNASAATGASPLSWFAGKALSFSNGYVTLGSVKTT
ncbi:MAG: DUF2341 domain-containing protein, partial [Chitinispirillaceae bacterium]|nr:DUF2341 domain-containing protein [Chitinispirillaceae bacterium]